LEVFREDVYGANAQNAIKNKTAVPRLLEPIKIEPIKKEIPAPAVKKEAAVVKKDAKPNDLAQAFAHAKPKKSPEKGAEADTKKPGAGAAAAASSKAAPKKGMANNIASMFAKQE
jgi:hypothetical protein